MQPVLSTENRETPAKINLPGFTETSLRSKKFQVVFGIIKIVAGLALLALSFREAQLNLVVAGLGAANLSWLALAVLSVLLGLGLKLWRWVILVKNYHLQLNFTRLFSAYFVGQAANIILPFRGGEVLRLAYFGEDRQTLPLAASTILLEKYLDLLALTLCALGVSLKISLDNIVNLHGMLLPITIVATLLFLAFVILGPSVWGKVRGYKPLPQGLVGLLDRWVQASQWLRQPRQILPGVTLTIFIWVVMWLTNLLLFRSLGLAMGATAGGLVLVLVYIGLLPALMPGNVGPFYFFASLALLPFGVMHGQAIIFAVLLHAIVTLPPLIAGGIGLFMRTSPVAKA